MAGRSTVFIAFDKDGKIISVVKTKREESFIAYLLGKKLVWKSIVGWQVEEI